MESIFFRFIGVDGVGIGSFGTLFMLMLGFIIIALAFGIWTRSHSRCDPLADHTSVPTGQNIMFLPVAYKTQKAQIKGDVRGSNLKAQFQMTQEYTEPKAAYLRSLSSNRATVVCNADDFVTKGSFIEVEIHSSSLADRGWEPTLHGRVIKKKPLESDPSSWVLDLKLSRPNHNLSQQTPIGTPPNNA